MRSTATYDPLAPYYDLLYSRVAPDDVEFCLRVSREHPGPILELGCGTGRLALALAERAATVFGLELSLGMLDAAVTKLQKRAAEVRGRCTLVAGDMRRFAFEQRFGLIILAYSSLLELRSEQERRETLECCLQHLTEGGAVVVDNSFRGEGEYARWGKQRPDHVVLFIGSHPDPADPDSSIQHFEAHSYDASSLEMSGTIFIDHVASAGSIRRDTVTIKRQYVPPEQMARELGLAGYHRVDIFGGLDGQPLYDPTLEGKGRQIFIAQR